MIGSLAAFVAVSAVVICTPGQDTALTIRSTIAGGRRAGVATAGGVAIGQAIWTIAASLGVVALLSASEPGPRRALRQGVLSNLGNPKMAVFFASLLPQFAGAANATFSSLLALGLLFCSMTFGWLLLYAVAIDRVGHLLVGSVRRALDALTGIVLVALGLRLVTER